MQETETLSTSRIWPVPLRRIEEVVSIHLGPGRVHGNKAAACFSRQVSMYLAKHVGGWSTPRIGRFYGGRHHTTVLHAISKIERCRRSDQSIDALLEVLGAALVEEAHKQAPKASDKEWPESIVDAIAARVIEKLTSFQTNPYAKCMPSICQRFSRLSDEVTNVGVTGAQCCTILPRDKRFGPPVSSASEVKGT
jgi:Bacterial dnaA protein helix-turn-helix